MPRKSRGEEIISAICEYLVGAVRGLEPITDERLMEVADCSRATFYKYVTKGSEIELKIERARIEQRKYAASEADPEDEAEPEPNWREKFEAANAGNRELLALFVRMKANLTIRYGIPENVVQAALSDAMPHPNRSVSHAGKGRSRKKY